MINFTFKLKLFGCIAAILFWIIALFYIWNTDGKIIFKIYIQPFHSYFNAIFA